MGLTELPAAQSIEDRFGTTNPLEGNRMSKSSVRSEKDAVQARSLRSLPPHFKPTYSADCIAREVARVGREISEWAEQVWKDSHTDILAIPVLRGGLFFAADVVRAVGNSVEIAAARTMAYDVETNAQRSGVAINIDGVPAKGRSVLLLDDICDSGKSLKALSEALIAFGAREVRSAVLIQRIIEGQVFTPNYVGIHHQGSEWFVGYGMDDGDHWRNLPGICVIAQQE